MEYLELTGSYDNGRVFLDEAPAGIAHARVVVRFLPGRAENGDSPSHATAESSGAVARQAAGKLLLESMQRGLDFGGQAFCRAEIYEERLDALEARRG